jgi:hypothetical protein
MWVMWLARRGHADRHVAALFIDLPANRRSGQGPAGTTRIEQMGADPRIIKYSDVRIHVPSTSCYSARIKRPAA